MIDKKIDFLVIGIYRAGTTYLQKIFEAHPQIFVPEEKELFFFSRYYQRGIQWYESHFSKENTVKVMGEVCPSYLGHSDQTAQRIYNYSNEIKIIAILRDPIGQIESMLRLHFNRNNNVRPEAITKEMIFSDFINNVEYYKRLKPFYEFFSADQILILNYDDLVNDSAEFLETIFKFIDVDLFEPPKLDNINAAMKPRSVVLSRLMSKFGELLRNSGLEKLIGIINETGIVKFVKRLNTSDTKNHITLPETLKHDIKQHLKSDYNLLEKLTNKQFTDWV